MSKKSKDELAAAALEKEQRTADRVAAAEEAELEDARIAAEGFVPTDEGSQDERQPEAQRNARGEKLYADPTREAIMDKAARARKRRLKTDTEQLDDEGREQQAAMQAAVEGREVDDVDEPEPKETPAAAAAEPKPGEKKADETVDTNDELVTIKVDGAEQQVPQSDVMQAGMAALQKIATGDKRLKEASEYESRLNELQAMLEKQAEAIQTGKQTPAKEGPADGSESNLPAMGAVDEAAIKEQVAGVAEAIYAGDQDQVTENLTKVLTSLAGRQGSTPTLDAQQVAQDVLATMRAEADKQAAENKAEEHKRIAETVNTTFREEFSELHEDDRAFRLTQTEFNHLRATKPTADPVALMREAGESITNLLHPPADPLEARRASKRAAGKTATTSAQRAPADKKPERKTRTDVAREMMAARGQG